MNQNSYICRLMDEQDNWRELLAGKGISIRESGNLVILNYGIDCDFTDSVVQEARGIIIDTERSEVVCWPFRKFGNYGERYADDIDWNTARVQEKIDGSIVKLWYDHKADRWQWSTNSMIDAADAHVMDGAVSFMDLIRRAENYKDIPFDNLDRDKTYIFELVAPEQKIVIRYEYPYLYHIGTRSNFTGEESNDNIGIRKPAEYPLHSLRECVKAAETLNQNDENIEHEGFVVVDAGWHRIKVKSPEYVYAHRVAFCHVFTKKRVLPMIRINDGSLEELIKTSPDSEVYVRYYQWRYAELKRAVGIAISKARAMYEELERDRKAIAGYLKNEPLQTFCFKALGNNLTATEILSGMPELMIGRLIEDYKVQETGK
ncbi:MAG: hypothetical protein IJ719_16910 [Clostridia bacterium]|nr:hypothetical protein [Clostridia bacterium]